MTARNQKASAQPVPKSLGRRVRRWLLVFFIGYIMFLGLLTSVQRSLIYQPHRVDRLPAKEVRLPFPVEDITVKSWDGLELHGWRVLGNGQQTNNTPATPDRGVVVLYFPGNAGNRLHRLPQLALFGSLGAQSVLVDYRGYGDNQGRPKEEDLAKDARAVWNELTNHLGIEPNRIVIYGESLGGGVATRLSSELCNERIEPGGLIIQSTFNSLDAVAQYHFPYLPVGLLLVDRFPSESRIKTVTCPILQIHGNLDSIVPLEFGQKLFDAAPARSKDGIAKHQFLMPGVDHNDVYTEWMGLDQALPVELKRFLNETVAKVTSTTKSANTPDDTPPN